MNLLLPDECGSGRLFAITDNPWIVLAIVVISAITSWVQSRNKKREQAEPWGGEDDEAYQPHRRTSSASAPNPNQPLNWEEELKRLLESKPPLDGTAGAPPLPVPPPIVRRAEPPPLTEPLARESEITPEESRPSRESSSPWSDTAYDSLPEPTKPLEKMEESTLAHQRVAQFHETVAAHMRGVDAQVEKHGQPVRAPRPAARAGNADARAVVALLRRPATARQAVLASFVLAPPKALEA